MRFTLRALLAVVLLVGVYVVGLGLAVGLAVLVVELARWGAPGLLVGKVGIFAVLALLGIARALFARRGRTTSEQPGLVVGRDDQPTLWATVHELADRVGTRAPNEIRLVPEVNAAVSDDSTWLGLRPGTRRLYLGLPLLVGLDRDQLRSVLAHELGHYSGRHTTLGPVTYRGKEAIARVIARFGGQGVVAAVFRAYGRLYWAVAHGVGRRQELDADRVSAEITGPAVTISALREIEPLSVAWSAYLEQYVAAGDAQGTRPTGITDGFASFLADPARRELLDAVRSEGTGETPSRYDTHPPTDVRVAALAGLPGATVHEPGRPARDLLVAPERVLEAAEAACYSPGVPSAPLPDVVVAATLQRITRDARAAARASAELGGRAHLGGVVDLLGEGRALDLARAVTEGGEEEQLRAVAVRLTGSAVVAHLLDRGAASLRTSWSDIWDVVLTDGRVVDPFPTVQRAVADPAAVADLAAWLADAGAPVDDAVEATYDDATEAATPTVRGPGRLVAAVAPVSGDGYRMLAVLQGGLVLAKPSPADRAAVAGPGGAKALLGRLTRRSVEDLVRDGRSTYLPWDQVSEARFDPRRMGRGVLEIRIVDGSSHRIKIILDSETAGRPWDVLARALGDAFVVENDAASSSSGSHI